MSKLAKRFAKRLPVVEVVWTDMQMVGGGWQPHPNVMRARKRIYQRTAGYVLADDKHGIMLASSLGSNSNVFGTVIIPTSQIVRKKRIR